MDGSWRDCSLVEGTDSEAGGRMAVRESAAALRLPDEYDGGKANQRCLVRALLSAAPRSKELCKVCRWGGRLLSLELGRMYSRNSKP